MHSADETLPSNVSFMFHFMFHFLGFSVLAKKHRGENIKTCSKKNQNMLEEISKHARRDAAETLKSKVKHPHTMFQPYNLLIINTFKVKKMKHERK